MTKMATRLNQGDRMNRILYQRTEFAVRPQGVRHESLLAALMVSLPPPDPVMTGMNILETKASWFSHIWYCGSGTPIRTWVSVDTDDVDIQAQPTRLLRFPRLLIQLWSDITQRSTALVVLPPHEQGEMVFTGPNPGRWILQLPNGLYAGVAPTHTAIYTEEELV